MADLNACATCVYMGAFNEALQGADTVIFNNLHPPVTAVLSGFAVVVLLFKTQVQGFLTTYLPDMERQRWFTDMIEHVGRLALVAIAVGSYVFWREWVVDNINLLIFTVAGAVSGAEGLITETKPDLFNPDPEKDLFLRMMKTVHTHTYAPIEALTGPIKNMKLGFSEIAAGVMVGFNMVALSFFASTANLMFFLILAMHKVMTVFVAGMGPLIMALWVFSATRHYAYSLIRFLAATGSTVIGAAFLMSISIAVVTASFDSIEAVKIIDGETQYNIEEFKSWVFSGGLNLMIGAYLGMTLLMIVAVLIGFSAVLAQRPQLEK